MKSIIAKFLDSKQLSPNSLAAYTYDLEQFENKIVGQVKESKLLIYQQFLNQLKPTAQRRKRSAVNQFLKFMYENGEIDHFYQLPKVSQSFQPHQTVDKLDLSCLYLPTNKLDGQRIALMIYHLGLTPSELSYLLRAEMSLDFKIIRVTKAQNKRVLKLPEQLLPYLQDIDGTYIFDNVGKPYSRQWFFKQLSSFLNEVGLEDLTAQKLREQYILSQLEEGESLFTVAQNLGLKTSVTLEKYLKN